MSGLKLSDGSDFAHLPAGCSLEKVPSGHLPTLIQVILFFLPSSMSFLCFEYEPFIQYVVCNSSWKVSVRRGNVSRGKKIGRIF